jgi:hypothetical protein
VGLAELTSADAVRAAVEEFDELGREEFLSKYGFIELEEVCPGRTVDWIADPSLDPEVAAVQLAARIEVWLESCT